MTFSDLHFTKFLLMFSKYLINLNELNIKYSPSRKITLINPILETNFQYIFYWNYDLWRERNSLTTSLSMLFTFAGSLHTKFLFTLIKTPLIPLLEPNQTVFVLCNLWTHLSSTLYPTLPYRGFNYKTVPLIRREYMGTEGQGSRPPSLMGHVNVGHNP